MNTLIICLLIACILPYLAKLPFTYALYKNGSYDNQHPREQQAQLKGFGARAVAAHKNSFEALLIFAVAVLTALATGRISNLVENLSIGFIVVRVIYHVLYLMNWSTLRSIIWAIGLVFSLIILGSCIS